MTNEEINTIAERANMIVGGYAFSQTEEGYIRIVSLHAPHHACIISPNGEVIETSMNDIEISIVLKFWNRNKRIMEETYA